MNEIVLSSFLDELEKIAASASRYVTFREWTQYVRMEKIALGSKKSMTMYHGSPRLSRVLVPGNEHGDPGLGETVFATPSRTFALAYSGAKWGDRDVQQSSRSGKMILREMRPGAFRDVFVGRRGYLYHVAPESFKPIPGRASPWELVTSQEVTPLGVETVEDVWSALKENPRVVLKPYDPDAPETRMAVRRQVARMRTMTAKGRKEYLRWRLKVAPPEVKRMFQEELPQSEGKNLMKANEAEKVSAAFLDELEKIARSREPGRDLTPTPAAIGTIASTAGGGAYLGKELAEMFAKGTPEAVRRVGRRGLAIGSLGSLGILGLAELVRRKRMKERASTKSVV